MEKTRGDDSFIVSVIKGVGISIIATLIGVLLFALVVKHTVINGKVIKAVNQFIKVLSVFLGCFFALRGKLGFIKGAIVGCVSTVIVYLIFSLIGSGISFGTAFSMDILFTSIVGLITGVIAVNVKK